MKLDLSLSLGSVATMGRAWHYPGATLDLDFVNNRGYQQGIGEGTALSFRSGGTPNLNASGLLMNGPFLLISNSGIQLTQGTVLVEWEDNGPVAAAGSLFSFRVSDGADSGQSIRIQRTSTNKVQFIVANAGGTQASGSSANDVVASETYRMSMTWAANDVRAKWPIDLSADPGRDSTVTLPAGNFQVWLGNNGGGSQHGGRLKRLIYLPVSASESLLSDLRFNGSYSGGAPFEGGGPLVYVNTTQTIGADTFNIHAEDNGYSIQKLTGFTTPVYRFEGRYLDEWPTDAGTFKRRAELKHNTNLPLETTHWHSVAVHVEPGEMFNPSYLDLTQLHDQGAAPVLAASLVGDELRLMSDTTLLATVPFQRGQLTYLLFELIPSATIGHLKWTVNGVVEYDSALNLTWTAPGPYWKFGVYTNEVTPGYPTIIDHVAWFGTGTTDLSGHASSLPPIV